MAQEERVGREDGGSAGGRNFQLDGYVLEGWIGGGSYGAVSRIRRKSDDQVLVWKEVHYRRMEEKEKRMIVSEVNILREIRNPFVVRYHDRIVDKENHNLYIVMEYCGGGDLGAFIKKFKNKNKSFDEGFIWQLLAQLLLGLDCCHKFVPSSGMSIGSIPSGTSSKGNSSGGRSGAEKNSSAPFTRAKVAHQILHRDIKPANILLDEQRNAKLGDFGMAKQLCGSAKMAETSVGTPIYMSPEVINEEAYDERSDIWALGCVVYELAALVPPFTAKNQVALAVKINEGKFSRIPTKYSDELMDCISWMLTKQRELRPRTQDLLEKVHL